MAIQQISPISLQRQLSENPDAFFLLDVREAFEYQISAIKNSVLMPMNQVPKDAKKLDKNVPTVVICHHGMRSESVANFLDDNGFSEVYNLTGGIHAWAQACEPEMPVY